MAINVEAEVNEVIEEDAFLKHFYISTQLVRGVKTNPYNPLCTKGFTIVIKEFNVQYSYQVAVQDPQEKRSFSRLIGRYYAYLRAKNEGFIDVPAEVTANETNPYKKEVAVINYFIDTVLNNYDPIDPPQDKSIRSVLVDPNLVQLPGLPEPVARDTVNESFVAMFEDLLLQVVGVESATLKTTHDEETESTTIEIVVEGDLDNEEDQFTWDSLEHTSITVRRNKDDEPNLYFARYYALYKLFTRITD